MVAKKGLIAILIVTAAIPLCAQTSDTLARFTEQERLIARLLARIDAETERAKAETDLLRARVASENARQDRTIVDLEEGWKALNVWLVGTGLALISGLFGLVGYFGNRLLRDLDRIAQSRTRQERAQIDEPNKT